MRKQRPPGQIITFYSFKGGVGRTMALANVAFLAACSGKRVLMMDWDLEAPGLDYYFRGMRETPSDRQDRSPGILDIVWEWSYGVRLGSAEDIESLAKRFRSGEPFTRGLRDVVDASLLPPGAKLDLISAGSGMVKTPDLEPYGEALAQFSWGTFFDDQAGGVVIDSLRHWAKENYDLVLIDSRTGLADVAGLCTMQIPDQVALCFILNRQNIDGTAQVAAAIKAKRGDAVRVRVVPMRVAGKQTSEESDARARAVSALCRVGGMTREQAEEDIQQLDIPHSDSVPFYEALAPFVATRGTLDPLTLNYAHVGSALTGLKLSAPELPEASIARVRDRLRPRAATISYLRELRDAEPERATAELHDLVEGASRAAADGSALDPSYVQALMETAFVVFRQHGDDGELELPEQVAHLLRTLHEQDARRWDELLATALEFLLDEQGPYLDDEEELATANELDSLLSRSGAPDAPARRVANLRRIAWGHFTSADNQKAIDALDRLKTLLNTLPRPRPGSSLAERQPLLTATIDAGLLLGDILTELERMEDARRHYESAAELARETAPREDASVELRRLVAAVHQRLATGLGQESSSGPREAFHALESIKWSTDLPAPRRFLQLLQVLTEQGTDAQIEEAARIIFGADRRRAHFYRGIGRLPRQSLDYVDVLSRFASRLAARDDKNDSALMLEIADAATDTLDVLNRRGMTLRDPARELLAESVARLQASLSAVGIERRLPDLTMRPRTSEPAARVRQRADYDFDDGTES